MRPLPLSENGLKGLLDSQPQGPSEARGMDPGWVVHGWEMEKSQKRKTQNTPNGWALDSESTAGRVNRSLAYSEERALPGHFAPCLPPGMGLGQAGLW